MADEPDDTKPDLLRDRLFMQAERGEITGGKPRKRLLPMASSRSRGSLNFLASIQNSNLTGRS